jgi:hypothetical protein
VPHFSRFSRSGLPRSPIPQRSWFYAAGGRIFIFALSTRLLSPARLQHSGRPRDPWHDGWPLSRQIRNPNSAPTFFITFFLYRHHRHSIAIVREFPDSAALRSAPVSRDGPIIRRKTIFGGSLTSSRSGEPTPPKRRAKPQNPPLSLNS